MPLATFSPQGIGIEEVRLLLLGFLMVSFDIQLGLGSRLLSDEVSERQDKFLLLENVIIVAICRRSLQPIRYREYTDTPIFCFAVADDSLGAREARIVLYCDGAKDQGVPVALVFTCRILENLDEILLGIILRGLE